MNQPQEYTCPVQCDPNRLILIINTIFKQDGLNQKLEKVHPRVIYMLIKYVIKRFTAVTGKYLHINEILTRKDIV